MPARLILLLRVSISTNCCFRCVLLIGRRTQMKAPQRLPGRPHRADWAHRADRARDTANSLVSVLLAVGVVLFGLDLPLTLAAGLPEKDKKQEQGQALAGLPITELSADEAILHALNRLAYGPRPGDVERVRKMGLAKWIDQQLNPASLEDQALEARLQNLPTLRMSSAKLLAEYPQPKQTQKQSLKQARVEQRRSEAATPAITPPIAEASAKELATGQTEETM